LSSIPDVEIRTFRNEDLDQVIAIEKASFPDPYTEPFFWFLKLKAGNGFIVAEKERIVGYAISENRRGRAHIISMAVSPDSRRAGIGESLVQELINRLSPEVTEFYLEVRPSNGAAILLYEKLSFRKTGRVKKRYYPDGEDALVMVRPSEPPQRE
jgi:[ribosomal protein S18]-alanine N-acetyltransferase